MRKIDNASLFIASEGGYKAYINGRVVDLETQPGSDYGNCESLGNISSLKNIMLPII